MYEDLADAVETMKENGFSHTFEPEDGQIVCKELDVKYEPQDLKILEAYRYEKGTDPGSDARVFAIQAISGIKGLMVIGYGKYADSEKAKVIDQLMEAQDSETQ